MLHHIVFDYESIQEKLQTSYVLVGDLIEYCPNNQEGWVLYRVIEQDEQKKLERISDYYTKID